MIDFEAIGQGGILMLIGMAVVFLFLVFLIGFISLSTFIGVRFGWKTEDDGEDDSRPEARKGGGNDEEAAAAVAAVRHQRASQG
jgi:sodium pump decarboxylase gamma subunit